MTSFVSYTVDAQGPIQDLRYATKKVSLYAQKGLRRGVKDIAVPRARALAPHKGGSYAASMRGAVAGLTGYIVSKDPRAGLLNFGGTRHDVVRPRSARALRTPQGPRAALRGPRTYHGTHSMERAAVASASAIAEITQDAVTEAFAAYFEVR